MGIPRVMTCKVCGAPRKPGYAGALCAEHARIDDQQKGLRYRAHARPALADKRRIGNYLKAARRLGATEEQAWWCAMACEAHHQSDQPRLKNYSVLIAAELDYLRRSADVHEKLRRAG